MNVFMLILGAIIGVIGFICGVLVAELTAYPSAQGGGRVHSSEVARIRKELEEKHERGFQP